MSKFKQKISKMVDSIEEAVVDLSSIDVTTLTGEVSHFIQTNGKFNVKEINKFMSGKGDKQVNLKVVAHSHVDFDQDSILFMKSDLSEEERLLFEMHLQMLESAKVSRMAFLHFVKEILD